LFITVIEALKRKAHYVRKFTYLVSVLLWYSWFVVAVCYRCDFHCRELV